MKRCPLVFTLSRTLIVLGVSFALTSHALAELPGDTKVFWDGGKRGHVEGCRRLTQDPAALAALQITTLRELEAKGALLCSRCPGSTTEGKGNKGDGKAKGDKPETAEAEAPEATQGSPASLPSDTKVFWDGHKRGHVEGCSRLPKDPDALAALSTATLAEMEATGATLCSKCPGSTRQGNKEKKNKKEDKSGKSGEFESKVNPPPVEKAADWKPTKLPFQPSESAPLVSKGSAGKLVYKPYSPKGDTIIDFSTVGFKRSEQPIPNVRVVETVNPPSGEPKQDGTLKYPVGPDSHKLVQEALNRVAAMAPDADGFRGAVLLKKGTYYLSQGLLVESGVVLRGEGDEENGTTLLFTIPSGQGVGIQVGKTQGGGTAVADKTFLTGVLSEEKLENGNVGYVLTLENGIKIRTRTGSVGNEIAQNLNKRVTLEYETVISEQGDEESVTLKNSKPESLKVLADGERGAPLDPNLLLPEMDADSTSGAEVKITDEYIPSGSNRVNVADISGFKVGDTIVIYKTTNKTWIDLLGVGERLQHIRGGKDGASKKPWGLQKYAHPREILAIQGTTITVDQALPQSIAKEHGGGTVKKVTKELNTLCGVEALRVVSNYDTAVADTGKEANFKNLKNAIVLSAKDSWVRNCTVKHVWLSAVDASDARNCSVVDCKAMEPMGPKRGGRYYTFNIGGSTGILFKNCYSEEGRHDFVVGARTAGPNAFVNCTAVRGGQSEPHARWGVGTLYDNVTLKDGGTLAAINRGDSGTGHGWAAANTVFWNCNADQIVIADPETVGENNFAVGFTGKNKSDYDVAGLHYANTRAGYWGTPKEGKYYGFAIMGDGHIESPGAPVEPRSLYEQQLINRIGSEAAQRVLK